MNYRHEIILVLTALLITSCNFTLAADVTPPPGYVPPTPMPTLGPLFPPSAPDTQNGARIYAEKCAPCHGETGFGDGPQGKELPVTVAAFALPETAHEAAPARWYTTATQGNIERFMPPFASLSDQERWDVVAYALTLHTTPEQVEKGKSIFEGRCADCADSFSDQERMASLSADDIVRIIRNGDGDIPAFGADLSDEDAYAVAAYLRTLTFAGEEIAQAAAPTTAPVTPTLAALSETPAAGTGTPSAEGTPQSAPSAVEATATAIAGVGDIVGRIDNQTGEPLPADLKVTLRGYDHGGDPNAGPQEVLTLEAAIEADGVYRFENVEIPERRIFLTETTVNGIGYRSQFVVVEAGATGVIVPDIVAYETTEDYSSLAVESLQVFFDYASEDNVLAFIVYSIMNTSDKTILVNTGDQQNVPFITFPEGAEGQGFEATQDSAPFAPMPDGFAMPPSETPYGLVAFASYPKDSKLEFKQAVSLPVAESVIFLPEGLTANGGGITDAGTQSIQGANFHIYNGSPLAAGDSMNFTISGRPKTSSGTADPTQNQTLLIGAGALGLALILAGAWMYLRDRNKIKDEEDEEEEFEDSESILDAIIALDDLHRAGKLSDEAHRQRREELKAKLKE